MADLGTHMRYWRWLHLSLFILFVAGCGSASRNAPHDPWPAEREGDEGAGQQPTYAAGAWSDDESSTDEDASDLRPVRPAQGQDAWADEDESDDVDADDVDADDSDVDEIDDDSGIDIDIGDDEDDSDW